MCESQGQGRRAGPSPGCFLTAAATSSTAVESTGTAKAEAESRSEAARIEGEGSVLQAKLKAEALAIETVSGAGAHGRGRPRDLEEAQSLQSQEDTMHPTTQPYSPRSPLPSISSLNTCKVKMVVTPICRVNLLRPWPALCQVVRMFYMHDLISRLKFH